MDDQAEWLFFVPSVSLKVQCGLAHGLAEWMNSSPKFFSFSYTESLNPFKLSLNIFHNKPDCVTWDEVSMSNSIAIEETNRYFHALTWSFLLFGSLGFRSFPTEVFIAFDGRIWSQKAM